MAGLITVGVAIAIPQPHATVLTNWRRRVGDPAADRIWPHVTLLPPTPVPAVAMDDIDRHLTDAASSSEAFTMHLSGTGTFRPTSPVVFIQIARGVSDCELIEKAVRSGPLDRELEFPYHPHVTVAQEIADAGLDDAYEGLSGYIARFPVASFELFSRAPDGSWQRRSEYRLGDPGTPSG
ncbi:MAG: 2'-5' RNA ligase family protein [Actinomycetota bacterium]|nr:2'-5' RNA ligase family protein [Actinomycetota bacterium]